MTPAQLQELEDRVMAHRYLYYVLVEPTLPDPVYDVLEREARSLLPDTSPVQKVGSNLRESYSERQIALAESLRP